MLKVIGIGDNVCDKYRHLERMFPGGQALNFSVFSRMIGHKSAYLGVFGDDAVAGHVIRTLQEMDIDISHCRHYHGDNGYALVDVVDGERVFVMSNKGGVLREHPLVFSADDLDYIASYDLIHTSNNSYIDPELPRLALLPNMLSYDFSGTWKEEKRTQKICQSIDFGFLSCSELSEPQIEDLLTQIKNWGCGLAIATAGSRGAVLFDGDRFFKVLPRLVEPVDTLGAGDSFAAGFLVNYLEKKVWKLKLDNNELYTRKIEGCLQDAVALSARTCLETGAFGHGCRIS